MPPFPADADWRLALGTSIPGVGCSFLCAPIAHHTRIRPGAARDRPLAGSRRTEGAVAVVSTFPTCHPLCSAGITRHPSSYGVIRLLTGHRRVVVSSSPPTAGADPVRSPRVRCTPLRAAPSPLPQGHDWIRGVTLASALTQALIALRSFAFARCCTWSRASISHDLTAARKGCELPDQRRGPCLCSVPLDSPFVLVQLPLTHGCLQ